jgi:hypothetical protein
MLKRRLKKLGENVMANLPTRIFRQGPDRKWEPVIQRIVEELK